MIVSRESAAITRLRAMNVHLWVDIPGPISLTATPLPMISACRLRCCLGYASAADPGSTAIVSAASSQGTPVGGGIDAFGHPADHCQAAGADSTPEQRCHVAPVLGRLPGSHDRNRICRSQLEKAIDAAGDVQNRRWGSQFEQAVRVHRFADTQKLQA